MVGKVTVGGKDIHAIVLEIGVVGAGLYRNSLIETLKAAALASINDDCELDSADVWNVLDIIQATLPDEE